MGTILYVIQQQQQQNHGKGNVTLYLMVSIGKNKKMKNNKIMFMLQGHWLSADDIMERVIGVRGTIVLKEQRRVKTWGEREEGIAIAEEIRENIDHI